MRSDLAVVDTNVVSFISRKDSRGERFSDILSGYKSLAISFQTYAELLLWMNRSELGDARRSLFLRYLDQFEVALCDELTCSLWSQVWLTRMIQGHTIDVADAWIAATAVQIRCPPDHR